MKSTVILFPKPERVDFAEIDIPAPGPGQILAKTILTGVSTGTETRVWRGGEDASAFPLIPGYVNVGEILEAGEGVSLQPGALVFHTGSDNTGEYSRLWGAHCQYCLIRAENAILLPDGIDPKDAIYTVVAAIAQHGIHRGGVAAGDRVAVVGLGLIGAVDLHATVGAALSAERSRRVAGQLRGAGFFPLSSHAV